MTLKTLNDFLWFEHTTGYSATYLKPKKWNLLCLEVPIWALIGLGNLIAIFLKLSFWRFSDLLTRIIFDRIELLTWNFEHTFFDINNMYWTKQFFYLGSKTNLKNDHVSPVFWKKNFLSLTANLVRTEENIKKVVRSKHASSTKKHICKVWECNNNSMRRYFC